MQTMTKERPRWANYMVEIEYPGRVTERNWFSWAVDAESYVEEVEDAMEVEELKRTEITIWSLFR